MYEKLSFLLPLFFLLSFDACHILEKKGSSQDLSRPSVRNLNTNQLKCDGSSKKLTENACYDKLCMDF